MDRSKSSNFFMLFIYYYYYYFFRNLNVCFSILCLFREHLVSYISGWLATVFINIYFMSCWCCESISDKASLTPPYQAPDWLMCHELTPKFRFFNFSCRRQNAVHAWMHKRHRIKWSADFLTCVKSLIRANLARKWGRKAFFRDSNLLLTWWGTPWRALASFSVEFSCKRNTSNAFGVKAS